MTAVIKDGSLVITLPLQKPTLSSSGKSKIVASTSGFMTSTAEVDGKQVSISVNAIIK